MIYTNTNMFWDSVWDNKKSCFDIPRNITFLIFKDGDFTTQLPAGMAPVLQPVTSIAELAGQQLINRVKGNNSPPLEVAVQCIDDIKT